MIGDYNLNRSELIRLRRQEQLYETYLPALRVKQHHLRLEHNRIRRSIDDERDCHEQDYARLTPYIALFSDSYEAPLTDFIQVEEIITTQKTIAGVSINVFMSLSRKHHDLVYFHTAPWLVRSLPLIKAYLHSATNLRFLNQESRIIDRELRKATHKVNLFDKILIPQTKDAIKRITMALADEHVVMVTRGTIAKAQKGIHERGITAWSLPEEDAA